MRLSPMWVALGAALVTGALAPTPVSMAQGEKPRHQRVSRCVKYSQTMGGDKQSVDIGLANRCRFAVSCTVEWRVSCDSDGAGAAGEAAQSLELGKGDRQTINASAARCGDDGWEVQDIRWTCERQ